ncbi:hypothetical protein ORV05_25150 [Amycolatopsis cynarae]|uniref:Putative T7SS secretion signal domain-containing protein n=1 Tax=Amycolatopsis cynarae TaxID=2995223 RepID=A0ABY7AW63_9PSEU|nr:hypothetical protein [Amycolatopsis sp. HUAS 11-8]WAL64245.1 hypothetical protein ORV05_25150 [Amycolatopsis sp. HUAS 11-8]
MGAELGQTTDPRDLIPGEPELIAGDLRELVANIDRIGAAGDGLTGVDPGQWTGEGANAFREAFGQEPPKWFDTVDLLGRGGQSLADYGDVLTWAQAEAQRAIEMYTQAQAASRVAAQQYDAQATQASAAGQFLAPFQDPGTGLAQEAQSVLANARDKLAAVGGEVAQAFGMKSDGEGGYKKDIGDGYEFGADRRRKSKWDPEKGEWTDPGGWQKGKGGKSYQAQWGDEQSDGMLHDKIGETLKALGFDIGEKTYAASAGVSLLDGGVEGEFKDGSWSGTGKLEGSVLGADAKASATVSALGVSGSASAEAYLAKGSAEGEVKWGQHAGVSGSAEGLIGAKASAEGNVGWTGIQGGAEAFAGAKVEGEASAEVAGVSAGVHGEAWAGVGAEASGQFGMGDDGKFHVGASVGLGLGVGGKIGFDFAVDPGEVVDTVKDVANDVGEFASDVGHGVAEAADAVGDGLGNAAKAVGDLVGGLF